MISADRQILHYFNRKIFGCGRCRSVKGRSVISFACTSDKCCKMYYREECLVWSIHIVGAFCGRSCEGHVNIHAN